MLIFVPILTLVFLAWAPLPDHPHRLRSLILPILGILAALILMRHLVPDRWLYPDSRSMCVTEGLTAHLRSQKNWNTKPIIILEGGSLTFYGVDGGLIERNLKAREMGCTVLEFASPGANHFERLKMFKEFIACLTPTERQMFRDARVLLLREVCREYDCSPILYLEGLDINRNVLYTENSVFLKAWRACSRKPDANALYWNLIKSTLLHEFAVGRLSSMRIPGPLEKGESFSGLPPGNQSEFDFEKNWNAFLNGYVQGASAESYPEHVPYPGWVDVEQNLMTEINGYIDVRGFYATPVLSAIDFAYQVAFIDALPPGTISLGPPPREIFQRLKGPQFWYDPTHTSIYGAQVTTEWLTNECVYRWDNWMTRLQNSTGGELPPGI